MYTTKNYPSWTRLPEHEVTDAPPALPVTNRGFSLALTLCSCWIYVMVIAEWYGRQAYAAAELSDFSLLGAVRADFDLQLFCLPIFGFLTYWSTRLVICASQRLWIAVR